MGKIAVDYSGQRFGAVLIKGRDFTRSGSNAYWFYVCDCGRSFTVSSSVLKKGHLSSCGCLRDIMSKIAKTTHGMTKTKIYGVWKGLKGRCNNPKATDYLNYKGRGITVCPEWENSFETFFKDMGDIPFTGAQIDRINNDGPYSKENCRWATASENCRNRRNSILLTYNGKTQEISIWAAEIGVTVNAIKSRIFKSDDPNYIFSPAMRYKKK